MKSRYFLDIFLILILVIPFVSLALSGKSADINDFPKIIVGTSNPGNIGLYSLGKRKITLLKTIKTGFKHVHAVRVGDIYNDGRKFIIVGMSNGLTVNYPNCRIMAYKLDETLNLVDQTTIGELSDLRCKDVTIGDIYNQGKNSIIVGTHGKGIIQVFSYVDNKWRTDEVERNFIGKIDKERGVSRAVDEIKKHCPGCLLQSAVGEVKIGDIDGDRQNEMITTISSPLENFSQEEISFLRVYKWENSHWINNTIDLIYGRRIKRIVLNDIHNSGKNSIVTDIVNNRDKTSSIYAYTLDDRKWKKEIIWESDKEKNMKQEIIGNFYDDGKSRILIHTDLPRGEMNVLAWNGEKFTSDSKSISVSLFSLSDGQYNPMSTILLKSPKANKNIIVTGGVIINPEKKNDWEETEKGYIVSYSLTNGKWIEQYHVSSAIFGLDIY